MTPLPLAMLNTGLVTAVGLTTAGACAAIRAGVSNASETHFIDSLGEPIRAHSVPLEEPWLGITRLAKMAALAAEEALLEVPPERWRDIPLLLCLAEAERHDRPDLGGAVFAAVEQELRVRFATGSSTIALGRVSVAVALERARELLSVGQAPRVLLVAADSLLNAAALRKYDQGGRLLTEENSDGFIPGEAAGAVLVGAAGPETPVRCVGLGFATEAAGPDSGLPLRAEGLSRAIGTALAEAGRGLHDVDLRITDLSGEQYYFKEAALVLSRLLRVRREQIDLWHPAECIGEVGAVAGVVVLAVAHTALTRGYAPGPLVLAHFASDDGRRAAAVLECVTTS